MTKDVLDVIYRECVELHDLRPRTECEWHNAEGLILAIDFDHHPCLVLPVLTSPIRMAQEMGPAPEEDFDSPRTRHRGLFMRNLDEESCRHVNLLSVGAAALLD